MPSPVMRIAPKPSRLTGRSPPNFQVGFVTGSSLLLTSRPRGLRAILPPIARLRFARAHAKKCSAGNTIVYPFLVAFGDSSGHDAHGTFTETAVNASALFHREEM